MIRRNTNQRKIVYDSLQYLGHASSEVLIDYIQKNYSNISVATIYRNLTILMEEEQVKKVKLNNIDVYETVKGKHFHYMCRMCGNIIDVSPAEVGLDKFKVSNLSLGSVEDYDMTFYGKCNKCNNE